MDDDELFLNTEGKKLSEFISSRKDKDAVQEILRLIELYPDRKSLLYHMLGEQYMLAYNNHLKNRYENAIEAYTNLLNLPDPKTEHKRHAIVNLSFAYKAIGDFDNAIKYLEMAFEENRDGYDQNPEYKNKLMTVYNELLKMRDKGPRGYQT